MLDLVQACPTLGRHSRHLDFGPDCDKTDFAAIARAERLLPNLQKYSWFSFWGLLPADKISASPLRLKTLEILLADEEANMPQTFTAAVALPAVFDM